MNPPFDQINCMDQAAFVDCFGGLYEHSPWIADRSWEARPFDGMEALLQAFQQTVDRATAQEQLSLIRAHPDLAGALARAGKLTANSTEEQQSAGLDRLTDEERAAFETLNAEYKQRFDMPFIICAKEHTRLEILDRFKQRLDHDWETEKEEALKQIHRIARLRLRALIEDDTRWDS